jgi:hypothetical protein
MKSILRQLQELADADLYALCETVELELQRRKDVAGDDSESARRRASERHEGYRHRNGAAMPRTRVTNIGKPPRKRAA